MFTVFQVGMVRLQLRQHVWRAGRSMETGRQVSSDHSQCVHGGRCGRNYHHVSKGVERELTRGDEIKGESGINIKIVLNVSSTHSIVETAART